jgi:outer membrane protein TolC
MAMRQAAERLPSVQVARALLQSAQAYASSIGAQPNPYLRLSAVAGEPVEEANALVFRFEVAGQPGLRERSAESSALARSDDLASEKRLVALRVGQSYFSYWEKLEVFKVAQARTELARSLERSSLRRFKVGEIGGLATTTPLILFVLPSLYLRMLKGQRSVVHDFHTTDGEQVRE